MPAIVSHHIFGRSLLPDLDAGFCQTRDARDAFLLGNQGPDPLFFATRSLALVRIKKLGSLMHRERIEELLGVWRQRVLDTSGHQRAVLRAYLSGFLCHFTLDSIAHPLVLAFEEALVHAGVTGLDPRDHSYVHGQIEADLDVFLLHEMSGRTLDEYVLPKQVLYAGNTILKLIDRLYDVAARQVYQLAVPHTAFSRGVHDMRLVVAVSYSPGGTKRRLLGKLERLARPHSLLQAMSHQKDAYLDCWYANEQKETWLHPQSRKPRHESYRELFALARQQALSAIQLFWDGADPFAITGGQNFLGNEAEVRGKRTKERARLASLPGSPGWA
ncbi:MAG: zinc dependent phospholipase C family protein [Coriobacteriales bacterium]|jgi:hypothetical protein|nr:zinc dependent phospholipase C family protein [Coriobacteriales bacterium]